MCCLSLRGYDDSAACSRSRAASDSPAVASQDVLVGFDTPPLSTELDLVPLSATAPRSPSHLNLLDLDFRYP